MEIDKKYDGHTVFVKCAKSLTDDQILDTFKIFLNKYIDKSGDKIECEYYVNILTNKEDISFGLAFVYISNSEVYYMLFGKNKDGSERVEYIDDPKWVNPPKITSTSHSSLQLLEEKKNSLNTSGSLLKFDWGVIMEADEEHEEYENSIKNRHICPKIKVFLQPLMIPVVNNEEFYIEQALPSEVQNGCYHHIIKSVNIPENINIEDLNDKFRPLISDSNSRYKRKYKGKITEHEYPYIIINNDRTAFIIFDESSNDARFAIHLAKKTVIKGTKMWFVFSQKKDIIEESERYPSKNNNNRSPKNNNNTNNRSPNNNNNNNSPSRNNNRSPKNNNNSNNNSPSRNTHSYNNNNQQSFNNNRSLNSSREKEEKDDNVVDTDGFRFVKYNRK